MLCPSRITLNRVVLGGAKQQSLSFIGTASSSMAFIAGVYL
jgi:hypothetical protein